MPLLLDLVEILLSRRVALLSGQRVNCRFLKPRILKKCQMSMGTRSSQREWCSTCTSCKLCMDATTKDATTMSSRNGHIPIFLWDTLNRKGCSDYLGYHFSVPTGPTGPMSFGGEISSALLGLQQEIWALSCCNSPGLHRWVYSHCANVESCWNKW